MTPPMPESPHARYRDKVDPRPAGEDTPFWSVMIPSYNCGDYLRLTLASVLAQDPGADKMQIEVVDDCSEDGDPAGIVADFGHGRVGYLRQPRNVGHIANFHTCIQRARGRVVHILHGDDLVEPGFYAALEDGFLSDPLIGAAFCRATYIDADGREMGRTEVEAETAGPMANGLARLAREQRIMTPSIAVRREVYRELGGFDRRLKCSEDWEMWVRIAAFHPIWYEPRPLAKYRMHQNSNTGRHLRSAGDMAYTRRAIEIFADYLTPQMRRTVVPQARRAYARSSLDMARNMLRLGEKRAAWAQVWQAVRFDASPEVLLSAAKIVARSIGSIGAANS